MPDPIAPLSHPSRDGIPHGRSHAASRRRGNSAPMASAAMPERIVQRLFEGH
jgi:hypothetical protein